MTRDQAHAGTRVAWTTDTGRHQTGTILAAPADQSEDVLVTWHYPGIWGYTRTTKSLPLSQLQRIPEVGR